MMRRLPLLLLLWLLAPCMAVAEPRPVEEVGRAIGREVAPWLLGGTGDTRERIRLVIQPFVDADIPPVDLDRAEDLLRAIQAELTQRGGYRLSFVDRDDLRRQLQDLYIAHGGRDRAYDAAVDALLASAAADFQLVGRMWREDKATRVRFSLGRVGSAGLVYGTDAYEVDLPLAGGGRETALDVAVGLAGRRWAERLPGLEVLHLQGLAHGQSRAAGSCGRELAERFGDALADAVRQAGTGERRVATRPFRLDAGQARRQQQGESLADILGPGAYRLEGSYYDDGEVIELQLRLDGGGDTLAWRGRIPRRTAPVACRAIGPDPVPSLLLDDASGRFGLSLSSTRGRDPVYEIREPPAEPDEVEIGLLLAEPAMVWCYNRDEQGRITRLFPIHAQRRGPLEAGRLYVLPRDFPGRDGRAVSWRVSGAPDTSIVKCYAAATDLDPLLEPRSLATPPDPGAPIPGVTEAMLQRAFRAAARDDLSEASLVLTAKRAGEP